MNAYKWYNETMLGASLFRYHTTTVVVAAAAATVVDAIARVNGYGLG